MTTRRLRRIIDNANNEDRMRALETERFVDEMKIRRAHLPDKWMELKNSLARNCEEIKIVRLEVEDLNHLTLRHLKRVGSVSLELSMDAACIFYEGPSGKRLKIWLRVEQEGSGVTCIYDESPQDIESIAVNLIHKITKQ